MIDLSEKVNLELTRTVVDIAIRLGLLLILVVMCFNILSPFLAPVIWAVIIAVAIYPVFIKMVERLAGRVKLAATLYTLVALALLILPGFMIADSVVETAGAIKDRYNKGEFTIPAPADSVKKWPLVGKYVYNEWLEASQSLPEVFEKYASQLKSVGKVLATAAANTGLGVLQFALSIIISAVFLVYASAAGGFTINFFVRLAGHDRGEGYAALTTATIRSVAQGVLGVAIIQAAFAGLGMSFMDVPAWGLWTLLLLVLAIAQLPPLLVLGPVIVYVFYVADTTPATIFAIYSVIVSLSDGFLKPLFLGRGMETPMLVILLGAIGGMIMWGIIGLFVGAIVLALGYELFRRWLSYSASGIEDDDAVADSR